MENKDIMTKEKFIALYLKADAKTKAQVVELLTKCENEQSKTTGGKQ